MEQSTFIRHKVKTRGAENSHLFGGFTQFFFFFKSHTKVNFLGLGNISVNNSRTHFTLIQPLPPHRPLHRPPFRPLCPRWTPGLQVD